MKGKIAVFCSASSTIDPKYNKVAREFVRAASLSGYALVTGATIKGTMKHVADEIRDCGGYHIGVIPHFMKQYVYEDVSELIWTDTISERKALLRQGTCAVVALPGGIGTLDEVIETLSLVHLKQYDGKIFLLNHEGFYEPLRKLLQHYVSAGMLGTETMGKMIFAGTPEEILGSL